MTHTYKSEKENEYEIGQYIDGDFIPLFSVPTLAQAMSAINYLNGGYARVEELDITEIVD
jgi:hypothetical protein